MPQRVMQVAGEAAAGQHREAETATARILRPANRYRGRGQRQERACARLVSGVEGSWGERGFGGQHGFGERWR